MNTSAPTWLDFAGAHSRDFFVSKAGQLAALAWSRETGVAPPLGWSLPAQLDPWPPDPLALAEKILSLLPGITAAILGDLMWGAWQDRSASHRLFGTTVLSELAAAGRAHRSPCMHWEGWFATHPVCAPLDPGCSHPIPVRHFIDRHRLSILDASSFQRLEVRRMSDLLQLRRLESVPTNQRDAAWEAEVALYREVAEAWEKSPAGGTSF